MSQLNLIPHNYEVTIKDWNGKRTVNCDTPDQVSKAIGTTTFGGLYSVSSPTGKDVSNYISF